MNRNENIRLFLGGKLGSFCERGDGAIGVDDNHGRSRFLEHAGHDPRRRRVEREFRDTAGTHRSGLETVVPDVERDPQALERPTAELRFDPLGRIAPLLGEGGKRHAQKRKENDGTTEWHA